MYEMQNCIIVSDLPSEITEDKLEIHFQKKKNGGNDVKQVKLLENATRAIIEFEDEQTVESVLQHDQYLNRRKLKVEKYENGQISNKLFRKVYAILSLHVEKKLGIQKLSKIVKKFTGIEIKKQNGKYVVSTDSVDTLLEFEKELNSVMEDGLKTSTIKQKSTPSQSLGTGVGASKDDSLLRTTSKDFTSSKPRSKLAAQFSSLPSMTTDSMLPEWSNAPFPQPKDGITACQLVGGNIIKRKFWFPAGDILIHTDAVLYSSYDCTLSLPATPAGEIINKMLDEAFQKRKLFYVGKDTTGLGFTIQSVYDMFRGVDQNGEINLTNKLGEIRIRLLDLGIYVPDVKERRSMVHESTQETQSSLNTSHSNNRQQQTIQKPGPFPQPGGLKLTSEYHEKDLPGFPKYGAIHMYFRFPGGLIDTEHETIRFASYHRSTCLPATVDGIKLYAMIKEAAELKKLFVVARKDGQYMVLTKVLLLLRDDYPNEGYLQDIYVALLKLGIQEPSRPVSLPTKVDAHYEEPSDDESDKEIIEILKKGGPFSQPENGVINIEKDEKNSVGFGNCGTINIYFRFAGGKMKVEGNKPSKSFEVQYSQMTELTTLPCSDKGRQLTIMLRVAFSDRKLFKVEKKEGEPSFRVRPLVTFMTADLEKLKNELIRLGIREPSVDAVKSLVLSKSTHPQGGALPAAWTATNAQSGLGQANSNPVMQPHANIMNRGARSKTSRLNTNPTRKTVSDSLQQQNKKEDDCSICLLPLSAMPNKTLPCKHIFHAQCVDMAISKQKPSPFCPFCIQPLGGATQQAPSVHQTIGLGGNSQIPTLQFNGASNSGAYQPPTRRSLRNRKVEENCSICLLPLSAMPNKTLPCKHIFHAQCVDKAISQQKQPFCPFCTQPLPGVTQHQQSYQNSPYGAMAFGGNSPTSYALPMNNPSGFGHGLSSSSQNTSIGHFGSQVPNGRMSHYTEQNSSLPGYDGHGTIVIRYCMLIGVQQSCHPNPGTTFDSTNREAYLPDTREGRELLQLLEEAFKAGLTFTIGRSKSSGKDNQITWNGIVHKTNRGGGSQTFGYPDSNYLTELRRSLATKGIQ